MADARPSSASSSRRQRDCRAALPRRAGAGALRQPAGRLRPPRRARRGAARGPRPRGRAPSGAGRAGARARHGQRDQPRGPPPLRRRPGDRAQRPWRRRAAGRGLDPRPVWRRGRRRLDVRPRRRGLEVGLRDLRLRAAGARGERGRGSRGTVELHLTYDEETGGEIGPKWLLEQGISRPDYAIGAGFSYAVVNAHNGCLHLEVEVRGRSAHAAMPFTGIDALEAANHLLGALYAWRKGLAARVSQIAGHRLAAAHGRADPGRHQHQRRARPHHLPPRPADDPRGGRRPRSRPSCGQLIDGRRAGVPRGAGRGPAHPAGRAADAARRQRAPERGGLPPRQPDHGRAGRGQGRAALYRRPPLRRRRRADRPLRRRPAHDRGGQRAPRRRAPAAGRPVQGDRGGGAEPARRCSAATEVDRCAKAPRPGVVVPVTTGPALASGSIRCIPRQGSTATLGASSSDLSPHPVPHQRSTGATPGASS